MAQQKLRNLIAAVENGAEGPSVRQAIKDREAEICELGATLATPEEPLAERLAVIPTWVRAQLEDAAGLLREGPERAKAEFHRLGIRFTVHPVHDEGPRAFLRAEGAGNFEHLAFSRYAPLTTTDRSLPQAAGSRTARFIVDLPANQLGPGWRRRA
jgi:hypothetical protein